MKYIEQLETLQLEKKIEWLQEEVSFLSDFNSALLLRVKKDKERINFLTSFDDNDKREHNTSGYY